MRAQKNTVPSGRSDFGAKGQVCPVGTLTTLTPIDNGNETQIRPFRGKKLSTNTHFSLSSLSESDSSDTCFGETWVLDMPDVEGT